jgi:hypothetical protein
MHTYDADIGRLRKNIAEYELLFTSMQKYQLISVSPSPVFVQKGCTPSQGTI